SSMNNLALSYAAAGRAQEALNLYEETLQLYKAKLGPDHPDTLRSTGNLAKSYADAARMQEPLKLYDATLQLRKAKLGPDHPNTLWTMNALAWLLATAPDAKFRDPFRAVALATEATQKSPKRADYRGTLGVARYRAGDWKGAIADLERAINLRKPED